MRLELEVLTGNRKGVRLSPGDGKHQVGALPYLLETEAIGLTLHTDEPWSRVALLLENATIDLFPLAQERDGVYRYHAQPNRRNDGGLEALFYNYFGVAIFYAVLERDSEHHTVELGEVEVLARKASVEQIEKMVNFILQEGEDDLLHSLGATRRGASPHDEGKTPLRLLEHLETNLQLLEDLAPYLLHAPLTTLTTQLKILSGSAHLDVQDQGLAWLLENLSVLEQADDPGSAIVEYQSVHYTAQEIQTAVQREDTDIYENRVIHCYLEKLLEFTYQIIRGFSDSRAPISLNSHEGYVSFFATMQQWMKREGAIHIQRVHHLQDRIRWMQVSFQRMVPVRAVDGSLPRFTPKVRANQHYNILFRSIHQWYNNNHINWQARQFLMAINSIPKLFELYALMRTKRWCRENAWELSETQGVLWRGYVGGLQVSLRYEPVYWMEGHTEAWGEIVNTENRNSRAAQKDWLGKKRVGFREHRCPDIVLEVVDGRGEVTLVVMDAKYTTPTLAFERDLPACALKYVHGLARRGSKQVVSSMVILYPDEKETYMDYRVKPFDVFGEHTQLPVLGAQGLRAGNPDSQTAFDRLLYRVLELSAPIAYPARVGQ